MCGVGRRARRRCSDLAARPFRRDDREGPIASEERETLLSQYPSLDYLDSAFEGSRDGASASSPVASCEPSLETTTPMKHARSESALDQS